ncbi:MAG: hypothetical protein IPF78_15430 [Flavobacteriales bacterium]|nr:hypothetical protein [Flavobacteriales bacterium]
MCLPHDPAFTVSFFTKGSEDKGKGLENALTYGAFILGIHLLFSLPFHLLGSGKPGDLQ